mmetsp:Transcript_56380/g.104302  ORF Transcript_56380/g.104302 Transcript_56380/m.104302 type:complete len:250 (+) Transcript_56380:481-1230(+)
MTPACHTLPVVINLSREQLGRRLLKVPGGAPFHSLASLVASRARSSGHTETDTMPGSGPRTEPSQHKSVHWRPTPIPTSMLGPFALPRSERASARILWRPGDLLFTSVPIVKVEIASRRNFGLNGSSTTMRLLLCADSVRNKRPTQSHRSRRLKRSRQTVVKPQEHLLPQQIPATRWSLETQAWPSKSPAPQQVPRQGKQDRMLAVLRRRPLGGTSALLTTARWQLHSETCHLPQTRKTRMAIEVSTRT